MLLLINGIFEKTITMKTYLLLLFVFISTFIAAQNVWTAFDQLVSVNEQWLNQKDVDQALKNIPAKPLSEQQLIQFHLYETEILLRKRNTAALSEAQQQQRQANLNTLHAYMKKGVFPINDKHQNRQPYFIDKYNTYCAVGYLMQQSGADAMARNIHQTQNYSYIADIHHSQLIDWAKKSGLSFGELALIQPGYQNDRPTTVLELHYNNIGADVGEYLELQQGVGIYSEYVQKIKFYNAQNILYKTLNVSQMTSLGNQVFAYTFPVTDSFANAGIFEFRSSIDSLVEKVIYGRDSIVVKDYSSLNGVLYSTHSYLIGESDNTPVGTSLSFCGLSFGYGGTNLTLQSITATLGTINPCLTLPITLGNFSYTRLNKKVQLNWETLSESNTKSFTIERSTEGINFEAIGNTAAAGNSSALKKYSFTDPNPRYINHYRLKQTDADGKFVYSKILFVKMPQANPLEVLQTLAKDNLQVFIHVPQASIASLVLYDFSGRKVKQCKAVEGSQSMPLQNLASGSYLLQLTTVDGQVYNRQVVR